MADECNEHGQESVVDVPGPMHACRIDERCDRPPTGHSNKVEGFKLEHQQLGNKKMAPPSSSFASSRAHCRGLASPSAEDDATPAHSTRVGSPTAYNSSGTKRKFSTFPTSNETYETTLSPKEENEEDGFSEVSQQAPCQQSGTSDGRVQDMIDWSNRMLPSTTSNPISILVYTDNDVLIGGFKFCRRNAGNRRLHQMVMYHLLAYALADRKTDCKDIGIKRSRDDIKREAHRAIMAAGGRFLKVLGREGGGFKPVGTKTALAYIVAQFRQERRKKTVAAATDAFPALEVLPPNRNGATSSSRMIVSGEASKPGAGKMQSDDHLSWMRPFFPVDDDTYTTMPQPPKGSQRKS